ncbi:MAG: ribosomal RNA small subunit methyltransferase A [Candidatus Doudnabacteria bacterium RIFCSPHIGHO2_01_FULL_49_9]|uniref:Ribosomal RNA small subunit methyltransferase A n=1 Tax=Candidatus Doudnabacteria bacterium RIFCSPHIGHO2_01_FULL_49_9 TaxID=1817827 RepID=A0A1F5NZL9_9BACT|nr:MAG: ribosomal RNA small subunit methyltransferase A [Candidatus Doudnabacteria bacterium RIFCSPHIGHO2_01_FULL_49_9]
MNINELKSLLSHYHIRPDKSMGQNFLLSETALDEMIAAAELSEKDTVLEIGPGLGVLTRRLAEKAGLVIAVEKDRKMAAALRKMFKNRKNVKIINEDALFLDILRITNQYEFTKYKVVANIPYYITGKLLQSALGGLTKPSLIVLLLQREVAERITAGPGEMSLLSVSVQFYADAEIISYVGKENFYPKPEVDSAVVRLRVLEKPRLPVPEKQFFQLVKIGFSNKRKQLQNNLKGYNGGKGSKGVLEDIGLNPLCRAQDLSLEDWRKLYERITTAG